MNTFSPKLRKVDWQTLKVDGTMSLNIKNEEAHRLARELAESTGESRATAVTRAVRERLERVSQRRKKSKIQRILKIARKCAPLWKEPFRSVDHGDLLYDEKGLPK
jgi:antitoxin VapB